MTVSIYTASIPVLTRSLRALSAILAKGQAFAEAKKIEPSVLLASRLAPDMFPLSRQVQIASDGAKGVARLVDVEIPKYEDTETTFEQLQERIAKTVAFLEAIPAGSFEGSDTKAITLKMRSGDIEFTGESFLLTFVIPNLMFHVTTAYNILRHNGVEIGKRDFLGAN